MSPRPALLLPALLLLAGCSERVIVSAGDILVVAEDIKTGAPNTTATVHYVLLDPQPLSDQFGAPSVARILYHAEIDCTRKTMGHRLQETTMVDGEIISHRPPSLMLEQPTNGTTGESIVSSICDPAIRKANTVSRSLKAIEREHRRQMAGD